MWTAARVPLRAAAQVFFVAAQVPFASAHASFAPASFAPASFAPASFAPASLAPATFAHASLAHVPLAPATLAHASFAPAGAEPLGILLAAASPARSGQVEPPLDLPLERQKFATSLRDYRAGDQSALARLVESSERMARLRREDAREVVAFYRALSADERRAGLAAEVRYDALYAEVAQASKRDSAQWPAQREIVQSKLDALIAECRGAPDPTPAARALSLAAVLDENRARENRARDAAGLSAEARAVLLDRAESRSLEALSIFARAGLVTPTLEPVWLLARVDEAHGDLADAREGFGDCLDLADRVDNEAYRLRALRGMITVAESTGNLAEQRELLRDLAAIREPKDDWWLARRWSALLLAEDEAGEAARFLGENEPSAPDELSQWHFLIGSALQRLGRLDEAEDHFDEVRLVPAEGAAFDCAAVEAGIWRAQTALDRGDAQGALALAEPLLDASCSAGARTQRAYTIGAAHLALGDAGRAEVALRAALEQGRALEARLARTDDGAVFGEVVGLETVALLADALTRQGRALEAVRISEEIQARALRGRGDAAISESDLRSWVATFERGLLTWIVGADTTVCAHVAADGTASAVAIRLGRETLHDAVRRVREAAISGDEVRARQLAAEIEARVVPEVLRRRCVGSGRLLVLAHGPLERMPFDLTNLADVGAVLVLPGLASSQPGASPTASELSNWSILGDPSSTEGKSVLPGARAEVETIARLVRAEAKTGDAFDRLAMLDALRSGRSLHVATHLVHGCGDGAHDAGLLLARGALLCAREIREIAPRLPLAVLAACETAEGRFVDAQALASVSNAFLASGTRNLCVTLWPVEDGAAQRWSEAFHRELTRGARPSEAALRARDALKNDGTPVSEWAAFRFVGRD